MNAIWQDICAERARQREMWSRHHRFGWGDCSSNQVDATAKTTVLMEEVGEVARAILEGDRVGLRCELVQVAAVAVAMIEAVDA